MNTMNSVAEKLAMMDERITGLGKSARKSRPQEQTKRREVGDSEEALFGSPVNTNVIQEDRTSYS